MSKRSTTILEDIQDTYISKSDPNTSFYSSAVLNLGDNYTTLFDLPISFISKSSKIHSSTLNLHVNSCTSIIGGSVYLISPSDVLIEQATWNSKRDGANWQIAGGDFNYYTPATTFSAANYITQIISKLPPIGYWRFGEVSGSTTAINTINAANNGTYNSTTLGAVGAIVGDADTAATFSGVSGSNMTATVTSIPTGSAAYSLECWFKTSSNTATQGVMGYGNFGSNGAANYLNVAIISGVPTIINGWVNNDLQAKVSTYNDNKWHHLVGTYDGFTRAIYLDGVLRGRDYPTAPGISSSSLTVGIAGSNYFNGSIDEPTIYNRALTPTEVYAHYTVGSSKYISIDITAITDYIVSNGQQSLKLALVPDITISSGLITFDSAGSVTKSNRPFLDISYDLTGIQATSQYPRILGDWLSSDESTLPYAASYTHMSLGSGTSDSNSKDLTELVSEVEDELTAKGFSLNESGASSHFINKTTADVTITEIGLTREDGITVRNSSTKNINPVNGSYANEILHDSPKSYWKFTESIGTVFRDEKSAFSGTGSGGFSLAQPTLLSSDTATGAAISLNGTTGIVTVADSSAYNFPNNNVFSVEMWIKPTSITGIRTIVSKESTGTAKGWRLVLNAGVLTFQRYDGTTTQSVTGSTLAINTTYHVAATYDGSLMRLYLNGAENATAASNVIIPAVTDSMKIGSYQNATNFYQGYIDELAIYSYVISATRMMVHYAMGANSLATLTKDYSDMTIAKYSISSTGNAISISFDPDLVASSISNRTGTFFVDYKASFTLPVSVRAEVGNDSNNFFYWDVDLSAMSFDNTWHTLSLSFSTASKFGNPWLGHLHYCTLTFIYSTTITSGVTTRGNALDTRGDVVIGKPSFSEIAFNSITGSKLNDPCGCYLDRTRSLLYVLDKSNNRILVYNWSGIGSWPVGTATPIRVIGQPGTTTGASNGDGGLQNFPILPSPTASTLSFAPTYALSPAEGGSGSSLALDSAGNLWFFDCANHRVLRIPYGQTTADFVIGQDDMFSGLKNKTGSSTPSSSSLYQDWLYPNAAIAGGVFVDSANNVWVADSGNCRVLRFPASQTTADLVLGASNFTTAGIGNVDPASVGHNTLSTMGAPSAVTVNSSRTTVWVTDPGNKRILRFDSPFSNGMNATGTIPMAFSGTGVTTATWVNTSTNCLTDASQNWTTNMFAGRTITCNSKTAVVNTNDATHITLQSPGWSGGGNPGNGNSYTISWGRIETLDWDTINTTCFWVSDVDNGGVFLIDSTTGLVQLFKSGDKNLLGDTAGSVAVDSSGNLIATSQRNAASHEVQYFARASSPTSNTVMFNSQGMPNSLDQYGLGPALNAVCIAGDQLIVGEERGRLLFWNGLSSLTNGKAADGWATGFRDGFGPSSFTTWDTTGCTINAMCTDGTHLWVAVNNNGDHAGDGSICHYTLPLTTGQTPTFRIALQGTWGSRTSTLATIESAAISYVFPAGNDVMWGLDCNSNSTQLWVSEKMGNRVFRIKNPLTTPVVDCVLGQANASGTSINQGGAAAANTMYYPGALKLDGSGNLWVSDGSLENDGNKRLLMFTAASIAAGGSTIYNVSANKVISSLATLQPAFAPTGQMVIGYNPYGPAPDQSDPNMSALGIQGRFLGVYTTPSGISGAGTPDYYLNDFGSFYTGNVFDSNGNLYLMDHNRSKIIIYRQPFSSTSTVNADNIRLSNPVTEKILVARAEIQKPEMAVPSGYEITDDVRLSTIQGDGRSKDSSFGIWVSSTNLCSNGAFESGTTGWALTDANSSVTWGRVNEQAKFGKYSVKLTNTNAGEDDFIQITISGLTQSTTYVITTWMYAPSVTGAATGNRGIWAGDAGGSKSLPLTQPNTTWERQQLFFTTGVGSTGFNLRLYAPQGTVYWDGVQVESLAYPTPFMFTNGSPVTRSGAGVKFLSEALNSTRSWVAIQVRPSWDIPVANRYFFDWDSGSNNRITTYVNTTPQIVMRRTSGGTTTSNIGSTLYLAKDTVHTFIFVFTATTIGASVDGGAFSYAANTTIPTMTNPYYYIGSDSSLANQLNGDVLWTATGTGTLTDSDAVTISGMLDPIFSNFPSTAVVNSVWWADTEKYNKLFVKKSIREYRIDVHNNSIPPAPVGSPPKFYLYGVSFTGT